MFRVVTIHREPRGRFKFVAQISWGAAAAAGAVSLACGGGRVVAGDGEGDAATSGSDSATEMSQGDTFNVPMRPDLGSDAVVCGKPGDYAITDEMIALLAGCEIYEGTIVRPSHVVEDLAPLTSLRVIGEAFAGTSGTDPYTLDALNQLEWVGSLDFSDSVSNLHALGNLTGIGDRLALSSNWNLVDLRGLEGVPSIGGLLKVSGNGELTSLAGLSGVTWIGGNLVLAANPKLTSLAGLSSLRQVDGDVTILGNDTLPSSEIDALLTRIEIGGEIRLE